MEPLKIAFVRFPFPSQEHPDCLDWIVPTVIKARNDPRVSEILTMRFSDTPITMTRNRAMEYCRQNDVDVCIMLDSDMKPDAYLPSNNYRKERDPSSLPFWDSSLDFLWEHRKHRGPCLIAAPYCGPPPVENIYVFHWATRESDNPNPDLSLEQFSREDAARRSGIEQVAALPTGLIMMDVKGILDRMQPPYFYYEWTDETASEKASTEDVTFTRDCSLAGIPCYVNWDAWAGHWKSKCVGRPFVLTQDAVNERFRAAMAIPSMSTPVPQDELRLVQPSERLNRLGEPQPEAEHEGRAAHTVDDPQPQPEAQSRKIVVAR